MSAPWLLLQSGPGTPAFNMALDEALHENAPQFGSPILRFYSWTEPAATFGYSQKISEIERLTLLRPLIRRSTGGGLVPHDADWTYTLVFPPNHSWHNFKARESYRSVHEWLRAAFEKLHVPTEVAPCCQKERPGQCFFGWEQFDLLWQGKKIAGAAQRRTCDGLLVEGSVQPPPLALARADWQKAMCDVAVERFGVRWIDHSPETSVIQSAETLAAQKYSQDSYNCKR